MKIRNEDRMRKNTRVNKDHRKFHKRNKIWKTGEKYLNQNEIKKALKEFREKVIQKISSEDSKNV